MVLALPKCPHMVEIDRLEPAGTGTLRIYTAGMNYVNTGTPEEIMNLLVNHRTEPAVLYETMRQAAYNKKTFKHIISCPCEAHFRHILTALKTANKKYWIMSTDKVRIKELKNGGQGLVIMSMSTGRVYKGEPEVLYDRAMSLSGEHKPLNKEDHALYQTLMIVAYPDEAREHAEIVQREREKYEKDVMKGKAKDV